MLVMPCLLRWTGQVRHAAVGMVDKTVMGAWCAGSYEVTPPGRSRAVMLPAGSTDRSKDSNYRVSRTTGQTQRETPNPSSLSYDERGDPGGNLSSPRIAESSLAPYDEDTRRSPVAPDFGRRGRRSRLVGLPRFALRRRQSRHSAASGL